MTSNMTTIEHIGNRIKRKAKKEYYSKLCSDLKRDSRKLWKVINKVSGKTNDKTSLIDELKSDKDKQISNCFAKYFSEVGRNCFNKIGKAKKKHGVVPRTNTQK